MKYWVITLYLLLTVHAGAQTCSNGDCDQLIIADLHQEFSLWMGAGSDCNGDGKVNIQDFTCMINLVPDLAAPHFEPIPPQTVEAPQTLTITVQASDPNNDPLIYAAPDLPSNASFNPKTRQLTFTPDQSQLGTIIIRITVSDGFLSSTLEVEIQVTGTLECNAITPTSLTTSPAHGEREVAVTRETILRFSRPLAAGTYDASDIYSSFGGQQLAATYRLAPDRQTLTLFYAEPLPASVRIRLTVHGDQIQDDQGCQIDADGDGEPGGTAHIDFDSLTLTVVAATSVCGRVFNSDLVAALRGDSLVNEPLAGVSITVDGMEDTLHTETDDQGNFRLEPAPAGRFFVHIDGSTATGNQPAGAYYPSVGKSWTSVAGQEVNVGEIYLPLVADGTLQDVSNSQATEIQFPVEVIDADPRFADVSITVPAGSLFDDQGNQGGRVGIAPVDPARLPGRLPEGLNFPLVITVQTDGPTNFDIPAPICFPNLPDPETGLTQPAGAASALWSFNHDSGRWEISGTMTVSADGQLVCSDPGVGIRAPGWHGVRPGTQGGGGTPGEPETPEEGPPKEEDGGCPENPTDPIYLYSGEYYKSYQDLHIKGRGTDFEWKRKYRSKIGPTTAQGNGWDHNYNMFVEQDGVLRVVCNGSGRRDEYHPRPDMPNTWTRNEFFGELVQEGDGSYTHTQADKSRWTYHALNGDPHQGKLAALTDRNGNTLTYGYDGQGRLNRVTDTLDRDIAIAYTDDGMIETVTDYTGRTVTYAYYQAGDAGGGAGDLKSVTTPAITGTPNGNDYPDGKTTEYTYSKGHADERLNHNLLTVTDPKGQTFLENTYAATTDPNDPNYDRVIRQQWGAAGEVLHLTYEPVEPTAQNGNGMNRTIVNDREGNVSEYIYDLGNRIVRYREYTGRADANQATTATSNRPTGKLRPDEPDYYETRYEWNADALLTRQHHPNGNITEYIYESDLDPTARPRKRGNLRIIRRLPGTHQPAGDQTEQEEHYEYDDEYGCGPCGTNFVTRHVDARGNETHHDYDSNGNRISTTHRISSIVEEREYNAHGQLTAQIHPDNGSGHRRRDTYSYYSKGPQTGYLQQQIVDEGNLGLTTAYSYDAVGNVISMTDPRGNERQITYNQQNQEVRTTSREVTAGSGIHYQTDTYYDANDNPVRKEVKNIDETGTQGSNASYTTRYDYEILNNLIRRTIEVDADHEIEEEYAYDANRNRILERRGEATNGNQPGNTRTYRYDERDLLYQEILAEGEPEQTTTQHDYDGNKNPTRRQVGQEDSPRNWETQYDGYNRPVLTQDPMGNEAQYSYDANGNIEGNQQYGELEDRVGNTNNQQLTAETSSYDAMDRRIQRQVAHTDIATGTAIGDGTATTQWTYTDSSQEATQTDDSGHETTQAYDTAHRRQQRTDVAGNTIEYTYDANSNLIGITEHEHSDIGSPDQTYTTTASYDQLDRFTSQTDNQGNQTQYAYDSRNNQVLSLDPYGNETRTEYDGLNRETATHRQLTSTGTGDGTPTGTITTRQHWDDSTRLVGRTDGRGNRSSYSYDAQDRRTGTEYADGTAETETYDVHGNVITRTDGVGNSTDNTYDPLNRLTQRDITPAPGVEPSTTYEQYAYDGLGRLVEARDNDSDVTLSYDSMSNLTRETLNGKATTTRYDGEGNRITCISMDSWPKRESWPTWIPQEKPYTSTPSTT